MSFLFQVFGVLQKHQVCKFAEIQVLRRDFAWNKKVLKSLKPADLEKAANEERRKVPFANPAVRTLWQIVSATRRCVMGMDESRLSLRSKIWGMTIRQNPPNLWITLNFSDTHDPIVHVLSGEQINMGGFNKTAGLESTRGAANAVEDPYAAVKFFHLSVKLILEELFGITVNKFKNIKRETRIFGRVGGYIGTVEAQGRGSLHLHLLLWLKGTPTSSRMKELLQTQEFRDQMKAFITANITAHVDSLREDTLSMETAQDRARCKEMASAYSRPLDPRQPDFDANAKAMEYCLARTMHVHSCTMTGCLNRDKHG
jgi:hypothetical protein